MQLSDVDIRRSLQTQEIFISDFDEQRLQPASYDVLLGNEFLVFKSHKLGAIDPKKSISEHMYKITLKSSEDYFTIHPNEFVLAVTQDKFGSKAKHAVQLMGKSSLARLGLIVHTTAGFIDPGNILNATLELVNVNNVAIQLYPGMKIGQIAFYELKTPSERTYGHKDLNSKYFQAESVQASEMWKNFDADGKPI
ncbi:MAG: dCTP deaminase [Patescibacteria group bacterium]